MTEDALSACLREALAAEPLPGKRVLDYGCEDAQYGLWLAAESAEVTLLDGSQQAIDAAIEKAREAGVIRRVKGIVALGTSLDMFADLAFDLVLLHAGTPWDAGELARIMRPHARLVSCLRMEECPLGPEFETPREWGEAPQFRLPWQKRESGVWTAMRRLG